VVNSKIGIIGAGPAGISCSIQLKRYKLDFLILEKDQAGGLLKNPFLIENYLGFPPGIRGEKFIELIERQIENHKIKIIKDEVLSVTYRNDKFYIRARKDDYRVSILVVATGTRPKRLKIPVDLLCKSRIFHEISPLRKTRNKIIAIIGSGDAAFDYALSMSKYNKVVILNRTGRVKCLPVLFQRVKQNKKIVYKTSIDIKQVKWANNKLVLLDNRYNNLIVDYLVMAIGREPNLNFFSKSLKEKANRLKRENKLYIIGDARNGLYRQTAIAAGDGLRAAMRISKKWGHTIKETKIKGTREKGKKNIKNKRDKIKKGTEL